MHHPVLSPVHQCVSPAENGSKIDIHSHSLLSRLAYTLCIGSLNVGTSHMAYLCHPLLDCRHGLLKKSPACCWRPEWAPLDSIYGAGTLGGSGAARPLSGVGLRARVRWKEGSRALRWKTMTGGAALPGSPRAPTAALPQINPAAAMIYPTTTRIRLLLPLALLLLQQTQQPHPLEPTEAPVDQIVHHLPLHST